MKYYFGRTYGRPWTSQDGEAFESNGVASFRTTDWHVDVATCLMPTHPTFLLRSVAMLDAISTVAKEQAANIKVELERNETAALAEENSIESQLALDQLKESQEKPENPKLSQWAKAIGALVEQLRGRIHPTRTWRLSCSE
jgi:hypothetical protein